MIIDKEWGLAGNENPLQGSYVIEQLTDLVEEAVLAEFDRLAERGDHEDQERRAADEREVMHAQYCAQEGRHQAAE